MCARNCRREGRLDRRERADAEVGETEARRFVAVVKNATVAGSGAAKPDQAAVQQRFRPRHDVDRDAGPAVREQVKRGPPVSSRTNPLIAAFPL